MPKQYRKLTLAILTVAPVLAIASAGRAQTIYSGLTNGDWNTGANWSLGQPTIGTDARINNNASVVNVNLAASQTGSALSLTIDAGDSVTVNNNSTLNLAGNLISTGTLRFVSTANESYLNFSSPTATLTGNIDFNYQTGAAVAGVIQGPGSGTLTSTGSIRGGGSLRNIRFTNSVGGLLENYQTGAQLYLDANNGGTNLFVNAGTIRALAGTTVTFAGDNGGGFDSTGGSIQANGNGAIVRFVNNPSVTGGNYSTTGTGEIVVEAGHTASATPQSLSGILRIRNSATLNLSGNMANNGSIRMTTAGNLTSIALDAPLTLSGTGTIIGEYSGAGAGPRIDSPSHVLTLGANQTVSGTVYFNNSRVVNNGTINANTAAGMLVDPNNQVADAFVNNGTMRSSGGGLMAITGDNGGTMLNTGTISSQDVGSITELYNNVTVTGGTWSNSAGGVLRVRPGHQSQLISPTIPVGSTFTVPAILNQGSQLNASGTYTVNGTLDLNAGANVDGPAPVLNLTGPMTLAGSGTLKGTYDGTNAGARIDAASHELNISSTSKVEGVVHFNNVRLQNNGLIDANSVSGMYVDPNNQAPSGSSFFFNKGTMRSSAGGLMVITGDNGGSVDNTLGTISAVGANSITELNNNMTVTGGIWSNSGGGTLRVRPGQQSGLVDPTITVGSTFTVPAVTNQGAQLNASGTYTVNGTLDLNAGANVDGVSPVLNIAGPVSLVGSGVIKGSYDGTNSGPRIDAASHTLTVGATSKIEGVIHFNNARVVNNGTIDMNVPSVPSGMYLDPYNGIANAFVNNATLRASNGGNLVITGDFGGNLLNNGTISSVGANSLVELNANVAVDGGTWTSSGGGVIQVRSGQTGNISNSAISAGSTFNVPNAATLNITGTVTNNGTLAVTSGASGSFLAVAGGAATLAGTGTTRLTSNNGISNAQIPSSGTLTIAAGHTVAGNGYFNNARVVNNGLILADQATASMYLDPNNDAGPQFINNGTIRAAVGATVNLSGDFGGTFGGSGAYVADGTIQAMNSLGGNVAGDVNGSGTYRAMSSSNMGVRSFKVATLAATSSGTARVTAGGGNAGTSKVNAINIDLPNSGRVDLTDHGMIVDYTGSSPAATIRSYIASGRQGGNWNGAGIMSSLANNANGRGVGYAEAADIFGTPTSFLGQPIDPTSVLIRFTVLGDADLNGTVNFDDLVKLAQNYQTASAVNWNKGDFNYDNAINFDDLVTMAQNYNASLAVGEYETITGIGGADFAADWAFAQSIAPEPTSLLATLGLFAVAGRRRRA